VKILNRRQHYWAEFLQPFNFKVVYGEGRLSEKVYVLSRPRDYCTARGGEILENSIQTFFQPGQFEQEPERLLLRSSTLSRMTTCRLSSNFDMQLRIAVKEVLNYQSI
jgi:hypothetical protein